MSQDHYTENMLMKVAWYYKENLTQNEIADLLELSRAKVVRMLERARSEGIVQFQIKGIGKNSLSIEKEFKEAFYLKNAYIIPSPLNKVNLSVSLSKAAAQYLQNKLQPNDMVGFGKEPFPKRLNN